MSLEEELVTKILKDGKTEADVRETCKSLVASGYFGLDPKKIEVSLRRYELLQRANSVSEKDRKKRIQERFEFVKKNLIEKFMEDPSITEVWLTTPKKGNECICDVCQGNNAYIYHVNYTQVKENKGIFIRLDIKHPDPIGYCFNCGEYNKGNNSNLIISFS